VELEDDNRDDDGDHAIGERFESTLGHDTSRTQSLGRPSTLDARKMPVRPTARQLHQSG
jgi:hypothetical protein